MKHKLLKEYFGYNEFRDGQEEIVDSILAGRDTFGIMPTGAGKSICFQLPALMLDGITLVISPLISLMIDQVQNLGQNGIRGAYLNSTLTYRQYRRALYNASCGMYKIIYVAPERLETEEFAAFAHSANISMITIDEAHCVSQWGHDFRPSYLNIRTFIDSLPYRPIISAFTATATERVREDVIRILGLRQPTVVTTGFDRKNLFFSVRTPKDKKRELLELVKSEGDRSGIIYCSTRSTVEDVCELLNDNGYPATRYHAGLDDAERKQNQEDFIYEHKPIMVATNAFGMGIDKSNVSYVIHYNMPKNMESYYQEAGRAGRDGSEARCTLLFSNKDIVTNKFLIEHSENSALDLETQDMIRRQDTERLNAMIFYCTTAMCLRSYILRYFGENPPDKCGKCSNCTDNVNAVNVVKEARIVADCVSEMGSRFGKSTVTDVLRGADNERTARHTELVSFGRLKGMTAGRIRDIVTLMEYNGYLATVKSGEFPILTTTDKTADLFLNDTELLIKDTPKKKSARALPTLPENEVDERLFEKLKEVRRQLAKMQGVPSFVIFSDATLTAMCRYMPTNKEELLTVSGVGNVKAEKYGRKFLAAINEFRNNR